MSPAIQLQEFSSSHKTKKNKDKDSTTTTEYLSSSPNSRDSNDSNDSFLTDLEDSPNDERLSDDEREIIDLDIDPTEPLTRPFKVDRNTRYTLTSIWVGVFLCSLDGTIVSTTMSNIASDFDQSNLVSWIAVSYLLTSTAFQPLYGKTSDILGRKPLLLVAQFLFGFGILFSGLATNVQTLSIARAISGIGGSGIMTLSSIILSDIVPLTHRGMYSAYGTCISNTSQMLGGPVGGVLIATIGWRWMFLFQFPCVMACFVITLFCEIKVEHIPEGPERFSRKNLQRIDFGGIIFSALMVSSIIFLVSDNGGYPKSLEYLLYALLVSSILGYIYVENFVAVEKIVEPRLIKGQIGVMGIVSGLNSLSFYFILFITPLYLQLIQHVDVTRIGFYTMFCVVSCAIGSIVAGVLLKRYNQTDESTMKAGVTVSLWMFATQVCGFSLLYLINRYVTPSNDGVIWRLILVLALIIAGFGVGGMGPGNSIFVFGKAGPVDQASAMTVINVIRSLGNVLGVSWSLSVYTKALGKKLLEYLGKDHDDLVGKLVKDSQYIYHGLDPRYIPRVLLIYRDSLTISYQPILSCSIIGLLIIFLLNRSVQKEYR